MATTQLRPLVFTHKNDPHWIIELWLKIHGGDPAPELRAVNKATAEIIRALAPHLDPSHEKAVIAALGH
ncbi:hypothetical protein BH10PSE4_BH10PSE4_00250 [soil metagenome]